MNAPTRTSTPPYDQTPGDAYQTCVDQAQQQAPDMAKRWYTLLAENLLDKSTTALNVPEKHQTHAAWVALTRHQAAIEQGFPAALTDAVAQDMKGGAASPANQSARSLSSLRFGDLELMGDAQVQDTLDEARLQQVFLLASDASFTGFAARLSTAQGFKTVKIDKNPLRPEIFARALARALQGIAVDPVLRTRWLVYGGQIMGGLLGKLYAQLQGTLERQGIQQAAYKVTSAPDEPGRGDAAQRGKPSYGFGGGDRGDSGGSQADAQLAAADQQPYLSREKLLTLDHLHRLMSGDYDDSFGNSADGLVDLAVGPEDAALAAASGLKGIGSASMTAALSALEELEKTGAGNKGRKSARPMPPVPVALVREQLKANSRSLGQSLAIEVVGLMIEQLSTDARLLAPVQQVIANAEPAFLRLSMSEPRFFSDKDHPARRLLESITAKSLAYSSEDAAGFADFMQDLQKVADLLTPEQAGSEQHFGALLQDFEAQHAKRNAAAAAAQQQAVQALLQAEQRNLLAEKIAAEIRQRSDFASDNPIITAFVTGPWAQVLAKERLLGEHGGSGQRKAVYSLALGDMLWSIDVAQAQRYRKRLVKIIPDLLAVLRDGLLSIDYPPAHSEGFFDELMRLHQQALTTSAKPAPVPQKSLSDLEKAFVQGDLVNKKQPWLDPTEARQSGFMDFIEDAPKPRFDATVPQSFRDDANDAAAADDQASAELDFEITDGMQPGAWVELVSGGQWVRAQLSWISPHNTLFMFTSAGGRSHSMTARMLEQLTAKGRFKVISQQGVLTRAFDNVAQTAMRNSVKGQS